MNNTRKIPAWIGDLLLVITALVWGGGFIGVQKSLETITPFYMIGFRFAIASIMLLIVFWKKIRKVKLSDLLAGGIIGAFLFLGFTFQTTAALYLNIGKLAFLTALNVLVVPFLVYIVYREHIKSYNVIAGFIAVIGFGFLNLTKDTGLSLGIGEILGVMCAVAFAAHITALGHYSKKDDLIILAVLQMIVCCILGFICAFIFEKPPAQVTMEMAVPIIYLGVFSTFIAFLFQTIGQKYTSSSRAALILCTESVFGIVFSVLFLKEVVTINIIVGAVLIFGSVVLAEYMHIRATVKA
ncbi:DMT family transporter [Cellulosilyticum sp. I15G10I2]|uniref:DMT family transporter n=1 Tax=Cellulosilyticum sp. I15G10I2 TaxID=1892843 RepID=UPI00085C07B1|nr:DMT family transporter [Cellulosilyticum sp. I15G10I2]